MPHQLLSLRNVPEDEAEQVRRLLEANGIDYYETPASLWGVSGGAIWLKDDQPVARARDLLNEYQVQRAKDMRALHLEQRRAGGVDTLWGRVRRDPLRMLLYLAVVVLVLYLSTKPFLDFGG
jgi:hypothetical protein